MNMKRNLALLVAPLFFSVYVLAMDRSSEEEIRNAPQINYSKPQPTYIINNHKGGKIYISQKGHSEINPHFSLGQQQMCNSAFSFEEVQEEQESEVEIKNRSASSELKKGSRELAARLLGYVHENPKLSALISGGAVLSVCGIAYSKNNKVRKFVDKKYEDAQDALVERVVCPVLEKYEDIKELGIRGITKEDWFTLGGTIAGISGLIFAQKKFNLTDKVKRFGEETCSIAADSAKFAGNLIGENPKFVIGSAISLCGLGLLYKLNRLVKIDHEYNNQFSIKLFIENLSAEQKQRLFVNPEMVNLIILAKANPAVLDVDDFKNELTAEQLEDFNKILEHHKQS